MIERGLDKAEAEGRATTVGAEQYRNRERHRGRIHKFFALLIRRDEVLVELEVRQRAAVPIFALAISASVAFAEIERQQGIEC